MKHYKLTIPGLLPGLNEYVDAERGAKGKYKAAAMKKQAENVIGYMIKTQLRGVRFTRPVVIHYTWIEPNRRRDKDNIAFAKKFIQDSLVHAGVLQNDGWKHIEHFTDDFAVDPKNPRVEVIIEEFEGGYWYWWLRTPYASDAYDARVVYTGGRLTYCVAYGGRYGVRPALYLESGNLVSDSTDTDGAYILQWNQPPSDPSSISYGTPQAGNSLVLSTGGSTDPEGDAISYVWERKIDSGAYVQLGITTAKTFTDTVPTSGTTYTARVKAVDANGLESGYCTGSAKTISYNTPPVISGSDQNLGAKTAPFTYQYTVTDAQAATQTITVTEKLTNGTQTIALRTYTATSGAQNTVDLSSVWLPLLSGTHVLTITATDSAGGSATRKITFSRTVSRIAAARAFNTDALVQKVFVSL